MEIKALDKLVGKYCKIITKEPGVERPFVFTGIVKDIVYDSGFMFIESRQGLGCL